MERAEEEEGEENVSSPSDGQNEERKDDQKRPTENKGKKDSVNI